MATRRGQAYAVEAEKGLVRGIGRWSLVGLTINIFIGAGIFGLPSKVFGLAGAWSVAAYLVCAVLTTLFILCFAEVASRFAETGGPYLYSRVAFGPLIGFEVGWLLWLARVTGSAALCNLLLGYFAYFWPAAASGWTRAAVISAVFAALTAVNVIGVREASVVNNLFTIFKLAPLLLFIIAGLFSIKWQSFTGQNGPNHSDFSRAVLLLIFAFSGFEMAVIPAGEIRDPQRHMAFALLASTAVVVLTYVMIQVVCIGTLPGLATSERPLVDAGSGFLGPAGASIISIGALISVSGTLNSTMLAGPRILFAMSEQRQLPTFLAKTHRRFRTPHIAILISAAVMFVLTLQGTFMSAVTISTVIRLLAYMATCLALPVLRFKTSAPSPRFTAPAGIALAVLATALSIWLLASTPWSDARSAGVAALLGLLIFFLLGRRERFERSNHTN